MTARSIIRYGLVLATVACASGAAATDGTSTDASVLERWQAEPATVFDAADVDLTALKWMARPVVVFADTPADPAFQRQIELLGEDMDELSKRDVIVIVDADPAARTDVRRKLRPRGFTLTLVGKDGRVVLRKPFPWDVRELTRSIDKLPLRRDELKQASER